MIHSVPARPQPAPCESVAGRAHPRLRPYVLGYAGFRAGSGARVRHRVLPLNVTTLIVDFGGPPGLVTGPRATATTRGETCWRHGITVGLTAAGVSALLGVPMRDLAGETVRLTDLLGGRDDELAERLGEAPDWPARFALLDERLTAWCAPDRPAEPRVVEAWWRLQRGRRLPIGALAGELGVSRRYLEQGFRRQIGLSPATVARVARFQRAMSLLGRGASLSRTATESGYADQPHFSREMRAMAGLTPTELCAFLQDARRSPA